MLIAEIRKKLSDLDELDIGDAVAEDRIRAFLSERKEDILTADVFGALKYLPRKPYLQNVLQGICNKNPHASLFEECLRDLEFAESDFEFKFWPSYDTPITVSGGRTEPDLEIVSNRIRIFVEAKLHSDFGKTQIVRQLLIGLENQSERPFFLLLVTNGVKEPSLKWEGKRLHLSEYLTTVAQEMPGLSNSQRKLLAESSQRVLWTNWRRIGGFIADAKNDQGATQRTCADIVSDLEQLLLLRSLSPFNGFSTPSTGFEKQRPVCFGFEENRSHGGRFDFGFEWVSQYSCSSQTTFLCPNTTDELSS